MQIFFSWNHSVKHFWEQVKGLSVSFFFLSSLPVSEQPIFSIVKHWFQFSGLSTPHTDEVRQYFFNVTLQAIRVTRKLELKIIGINFHFELKTSFRACVKIFMLKILLDFSPHVSKYAALREKAESVVARIQLHMNNTLGMSKFGFLSEPHICVRPNRNMLGMFGILLLCFHNLKVVSNQLIFHWHVNWFVLHLWVRILYSF